PGSSPGLSASFIKGWMLKRSNPLFFPFYRFMLSSLTDKVINKTSGLDVKLMSITTCPEWGHLETEELPTDESLWFYGLDFK
ncbi:MAG: hypothetical protein R3261_04540, partial [Alphaproteobacteria bacterium]|nr:hypothetical protein [Alphaproteobacteria bacterium]